MDTFFCFLTIAGSFYNAPKNIFEQIINYLLTIVIFCDIIYLVIIIDRGAAGQ